MRTARSGTGSVADPRSTSSQKLPASKNHSNGRPVVRPSGMLRGLARAHVRDREPAVNQRSFISLTLPPSIYCI